MANRLTDTTIWKKQKWFKKLSIEHKLVWKYLTDECNHAGVWKIDLSELLDDLGLDDFDFENFIKCCNKDFDKKTGRGILRQRVMKFNEDFIWITGFMTFQYGGKTQILNTKNNAVISAIIILKSLDLFQLGIKLKYFKIEKYATPLDPLEAPLAPLLPPSTPLKPPKPLKEIEKEKDIVFKEEVSKGKEIVRFKLQGFDEIKVSVLANCEDWQLRELVDFVKCSQQNFEAVAMNNPLMNVHGNFNLVIQEFINMIQSTNDYKESNELRRFFGNWIGKKNGTLAKFIEECKNKETLEPKRKNLNSII